MKFLNSVQVLVVCHVVGLSSFVAGLHGQHWFQVAVGFITLEASFLGLIAKIAIKDRKQLWDEVNERLRQQLREQPAVHRSSVPVVPEPAMDFNPAMPVGPQKGYYYSAAAEHLLLTRRRLGLTQQELAEKLGYSGASAISAMETGINPVSVVAMDFLNSIK